MISLVLDSTTQINKSEYPVAKEDDQFVHAFVPVQAFRRRLTAILQNSLLVDAEIAHQSMPREPLD